MAWLSSVFSSAPPEPVSTSVFSRAPAVPVSRFKIPSIPAIPAHLQPPRKYVLIGAASVGTLLVVGTVSSALRSSKPKPIVSPKEAVQRLSAEDLTKLPYPLDALPGARDVDSPWGSVRVYEWGPEDGEKVLLIHGISTPSIALADLAHKLVGRGCRVMLFGMFYIAASLYSLALVLSVASMPGRLLLLSLLYAFPSPYHVFGSNMLPMELHVCPALFSH
jgi:hypothetical protein